MSWLGILYEKIAHRPAPKWLRRNGPIALAWKEMKKSTEAANDVAQPALAEA